MLIIVVSPITAAPVFDYTSFYLTNPLGIFFQNGQQNPAVWPWVKPCCVIPTTTTVPPTFTTTKGINFYNQSSKYCFKKYFYLRPVQTRRFVIDNNSGYDCKHNDIYHCR